MTEPTQPTIPRYPMRLVSARTGLSPHVLRAWERRYQVVTPTRTEAGQRLYSDLDIERLRLLGRLTDLGHSIGRIATLPLEELRHLDRTAPPPSTQRTADEAEEAESTRASVKAALQAARAYDGAELQATLDRAAVTYGIPVFLEEVVVPIVSAIGHGWEEGSVTVAQEHMATAVLRRVLGWLLGVYQQHGTARQAVVGKRLLVATPSGQVHELGALLAGVSGAAEGWSVTYLGPDLPTAEVVEAARETRADAVALSIVYDSGATDVVAALREARGGIPEQVPLVVGGAAIQRLRRPAETIGALVVDDLADFRALLRRLEEGGAGR
jgi:methanogenic corrinoid protein MtbC1